MTTDYAPSKISSINKPQVRTKHLSWTSADNKFNINKENSTWFFLGLGAGIFIACTLIWLFGAKPVLTKNTVVSTTSQKTTKPDKLAQKSTEKTKENTLADNDPKFDFYTMLPNMSLDADLNNSYSENNQSSKIAKIAKEVANAKLDSNQPSKTNNQQLKIANNNEFILQLGSFKDPVQADSLKANLTLSGFEAKVQTVTNKNQQTWYRVYLGPFPDKALASNMQRILEQDQQLQSLVLKITV